MLKVLVILSLTSVSLGSPLGTHSGEDKPSPRIVGGGPVDIEDFPYQLAFNSGEEFCGASIISKDWVLTAARCTTDAGVASMSLRAGSSKHNTGGSVHNVTQKIEHPNYTLYSDDYDYALLQVNPPFVWGPGVATIPLVDAGTEFPAGTNTLVSGWGLLNYGATELPSNLQAVEVPLTSVARCKAAYGPSLTDRMICTVLEEGGKGFCQFDYGGPLVIGGKLAGVVSFTHVCADDFFPGVYSKVADQRDWIRQNTGV